MAVNSPHPDYVSSLSSWQLLRDCIKGDRAIKAGRERYVPRFDNESDERYLARLNRATWFGATSRTADGMHGFMFLRDPVIELPKDIEKINDNADASGTPLYEFIKGVSRQLIGVGRAGILVDLPLTESTETLPYLAVYKAEDIIGWKISLVNGMPKVTMVRLKEVRTQPSEDDPYVDVAQHIVRVLKIENGVYIQEVHVRDSESTGAPDHVSDFVNGTNTINNPLMLNSAGSAPAAAPGTSSSNKEVFKIESSVIPKIKGRAMDFIPFVFVNPTNCSPTPEKPPLEDVAVINLSLFNTMVDLEHGAHMTALPTPVFTGFSPDEKINLGSSEGICSSLSTAKAEFLEFSGVGLAALEARVADKKSEMAILGARLLEGQKAAAEAAETVRMRQSGDVSVMTQLSISVGLAIETALKTAALMAGSNPDEVKVDMNTEFIDTDVDINGLVSAWQKGAISQTTLLENLKKAEIISPNRSVEDEAIEIESEKKATVGKPLPKDASA